jgi:DNA repair photolyase
MQLVCKELAPYKEQLLIRVTIGSMNPLRCKFWERNAPSPQERLMALQHAKEAGFETSVSMEPMLHGIEEAEFTFTTVEPHVTEKVWIGPMNKMNQRVDTSNDNYNKAVADIIRLQSGDELQKLYDKLKDHPKISWKQDYLETIGLK